jgi:hypothetical protein
MSGDKKHTAVVGLKLFYMVSPNLRILSKDSSRGIIKLKNPSKPIVQVHDL